MQSEALYHDLVTINKPLVTTSIFAFNLQVMIQAATLAQKAKSQELASLSAPFSWKCT